MTNAELNLAIAKLVYPDAEYVIKDLQSETALVRITTQHKAFDFPFTYMLSFDLDNWNDLMPLVVEHKISLVYLGHGRWKSESDWDFEKDSSIEILGVPQRALAECLLKVLEDKQ